jgi:cell wall-associated NlpC family hydrolase
MTQPSQATAPASFADKLSRRSLIAGVLAVVLFAAAIVIVAVGGDSRARGTSTAKSGPTGAHGATAPRTHAPAVAHAGAGATKGAAGAGRRANVAETADPEEASSFPAPASVHHKAAATPASASEQVVAAGAPSDAEVEQELAQMQAVERSAQRQQKLDLTPVPGGESVGGDGTIPIPANVPEVVQRVIAGANAIADFPYVFGGGHASFVDNAYDCSGSVSYALAAGGLLSSPETSGELESWGAPGPGRYITVYANAGHTYMYVDGVLFDTAGRSGVYASRWQVAPTNNAGYVVRHPPGL